MIVLWYLVTVGIGLAGLWLFLKAIAVQRECHITEVLVIPNRYVCPAWMSVLASIVLLFLFASAGWIDSGTAISESRLSTGTAYVVFGETVHDSERYLAIVQIEDSQASPRLYTFREPPPERFLVIHNEKGNREYLPRPLPE